MSKIGIHFHPNTKKHDGLCKDSKLLEKLIFSFFYTKKINSKELIVNFVNSEMDNLDMDKSQGLLVLKTTLLNLIERLHSVDNNYTIPLLKGGGGNGYSLGSAHIKFVKFIYECLC